jgi:hypothetical protein
MVKKNPLNDALWVPYAYVTTNAALYWSIVILFQFIPSAVLAGIQRITGKDSM